jgi:hypothetical protein
MSVEFDLAFDRQTAPQLQRPAPPRAITPRRLAANRRNARKSTGPRSLEGKRRSSMNALKHGHYKAPADLRPTSTRAFRQLRQTAIQRTIELALFIPPRNRYQSRVDRALWTLSRPQEKNVSPDNPERTHQNAIDPPGALQSAHSSPTATANVSKRTHFEAPNPCANAVIARSPTAPERASPEM